MSSIRTYVIKLDPSKAQEERFGQWLGSTRFIWNCSLEYLTWMYRGFGVSVKKADLQREIAECKSDFPWIRDVHSQAVQETTDRLYLAMQSFFRRVKAGDEKPGYPKFKSKNKGDHNSFTFKQDVKVNMKTHKITLPKIGEMKFYGTQDIPSKIKTCQIVKDFDGWHAHVVCEDTRERLTPCNKVVGIDLGVKTLVVLSDGTTVENPHLDKEFDQKIANLQRALSRKKKGSKNRKKTQRQISKLYGLKRRKKKDFMHKATTKIINENQVIFCEDLKTKNLTKRCKAKKDEQGNYLKNGQAAKSGLSKAILNASPGMLVQMLENKANLYGRTLIKVAPQHTSQDCHVCGFRNKKLRLSHREWTCPDCGTHHDRDLNASINILNRGVISVIEERKKLEAGHAFITLKYNHGDMSCISNEVLLNSLAATSRRTTFAQADYQLWEQGIQ